MKTKSVVIVWLVIIVNLFLSALTYADDNEKMPITDSVIAGQIGAQVLLSPIAKDTDVKVVVSNRAVEIIGVAKSNSEAEELIEIAASNPYTVSVETRDLSVKGSQQPLTDTFITAKVKGILIRNYLFNTDMNVPAFQIHVETKDGVVYLTGTTETEAQRVKAERLARSVQGVKNVKSTLEVYVDKR